MVDDPKKQAEALRRMDVLARQDDRLRTVQVLGKTKGWSAVKTATVGEYFRRCLAGMAGFDRAYFTESRLEELIEEAARIYDGYMAKQGKAAMRGVAKGKGRARLTKPIGINSVTPH